MRTLVLVLLLAARVWAAPAITYPPGDGGGGPGGGAPETAPYVTTTPDGTLTNEQALSLLATGLLVNSTGSGSLTIYGGALCTSQFIRSLTASGVATCQGVSEADLTFNPATQTELDTAVTQLTGDLSGVFLPLASVEQGDTLDCTSGTALKVTQPVIGTGGPVTLGSPQLTPGTTQGQLCILQGSDDGATVSLGDGAGVQLSDPDGPVILHSRAVLVLEWNGVDRWRQVSQSGVPTPVVIPDVSGQVCGPGIYTEDHPCVFAPAGPTGPRVELWSDGGNIYQNFYNADGSRNAGYDPCVLWPDTVCNYWALVGSPIASWQIVGQLRNDAGLTLSKSGIFAETEAHIEQATNAHQASAISLTPLPGSVVSSTHVQGALAQLSSLLASAVGGGTLPTELLNIHSASPAVNAGLCLAGVTTDRLGTVRPQQGLCDIGAYEVRATAVGLKANVVLTADLPAASAAMDGTLMIENGGAGNQNLVLYSNGQRFRIDGGAPF